MELFLNTKINFMGVRRVAFAISLVMIGISIISIIAHGGVRLGVDFSGGILLQVQSEKPLPAQDIRATLEKMGMGDAEIQQFGHESESIIRIAQSKTTPELATNIVKALNADYPDNRTELRRQELVGPKVGAELRRTATLAILFALIGMLIYIWFRFEFMFGLGGVVALAHDVVITLGFLSLTNREITLTIIAALLTIVGYSINDTIVVYDRIRENLQKTQERDLSKVINSSINETLSRTLLTSFTTILAILAVAFFARGTIQDFAVAMTVGIVVGTYSSIYVTAPLSILIDKQFFHRNG